MNLRKSILRHIGFSRTFDRAHALAYFLVRHRRWPGHYLFNDRLFRLKCSGELLDPLRQAISDKCLAKDYIACHAGPQYVVKTLAILRTEEELREYVFPKECVVKPSHASGVVMLVKDGAVDREIVKRWLKMDFYRVTREENYAFLKPSILVEEYALGTPGAADDYKVHCFNGVPRAIQHDQDRFGNHRRVVYDTSWVPLPYRLKRPLGTQSPPPSNLAEMLEVAASLSRGFSLVRVDFYTDGHVLKVGEITNCHGSGGEPFAPRSRERDFSKLLFG